MAKRDPYAALRFKEFNIFLLLRFILVFGWSMQFIIIEWQVYTLTKDPLSLGIIGLMEIIPAFSMALFAGHIVDQSEKRNLLLKCIGLFSLISFGLFFLTSPSVEADWSSKTILYTIYAFVFMGGLLRAFFGPTIFSLVALIVPKKAYPNAATWNSSTWQMASMLGPALAGFTINWIGVHWSLCIVFGLVVLSFILLFGISRKPILNPKIGEPIMQSLKEGVRFVFKTKAILGALSLDMIAVLFGGAVALLPVFAQDILEVGSEGFGVLRAAPAVGAFITMLITAYIPISKNAGLKLLAAIFGFGVCIIVFGLSSIFWISVVALFFSGVTDGVSMVIRQTILQLKTPDHMRGRVSSVNSMFVGSSNELGAFESGVTAKLMGTVTAVVFGGTMTLITVITTGIVSPTFRKLDLEKDLDAHETQD
ncbi:MFS transporter [Formosa sp. Hel1_33_131]|jgi:MFS family permease|uniref:MFS transporter n=1 Tax=Formosa sp. Hel1_33_131 TaxID=1336794 RepID=UPI00084E1DDD|nr:MFS transporter [Formosa sp. Hel1_33_131]AOR28128.1 MFS transporter [Formosa sp. Hel1_33_131]